MNHMPIGRQLTLAWGLVSLAAVAALLTPINSYDIWWHMDSGRWMLEHRAFLNTEIRSFTHAGEAWPNFAWLFQVLVAATQALAGAWGLLALKGLLWLGIFGLIGVTNLRDRQDFLPLLVATIVSLAFFHHYLYLRPHILEAVYLLLLVMLLKGSWRRGHLPLALLLLVAWSNTHASAVVAATALGIHLLFDPAPRAALPGLAHRLGAAALLPLCLILTPNGIGIADVLLSHGGGDIHLAYIKEWQAPAQAWILPLAGVLIAVVYRLQGRHFGYGELFLLGFFAFMAFDSQRFQFELALLAIRPMTLALRALSDTLSAQRQHAGPAVTLTLAASLATQIPAPNPVSPVRLAGFPIDSTSYPNATTRVLLNLAAHLDRPVRVLNHYGFGGYLEWAGQGRLQTFIDGRTPTVFPAIDIITMSIAGSDGHFTTRVIQRTSPDAVLLKRRLDFDDRALRRAGWHLAAFDFHSRLYLREPALSAVGLTPLGDHTDILGPADSETQRIAEIAQLKQLLGFYPDNFLALARLGILLAATPHDPVATTEGITMLRRAWQLEPGQVQIGLYLADVLLRQQGSVETRRELFQVLEDIRRYAPPEDPTDQLWAAQMYLQAGYPEVTLALLDPDDTTQRLKLDGGAEVWITRGHAYAWLDDVENAASCLSIARLLTDNEATGHPIDLQTLQRMVDERLSAETR